MPHMYFMSSFNSPLSASRSSSISVTNRVVSAPAPAPAPTTNQSSNLRDMFHAIRTGSNSCKSCGRG